MTQIWAPRSYETEPPPIHQFQRSTAQVHDECDGCDALLSWRTELDADAQWKQATCVWCGWTFESTLDGTITGIWEADGFPTEATK